LKTKYKLDLKDKNKSYKKFLKKKNEQKYEIKIKMTELKIIIYTN
jgi:hypothetical protein